ncbi:MAG: PA2169 family four-helix-bundle protein [Acidobacteria bacterium]|nr:PA2169 family four-helix-bundle protein [Acidobacteriota bacterium]
MPISTPQPPEFAPELIRDPLNQNEDLISTLNGMIETCRDGQEGFKQAAEGINDPEIKKEFYQYSQQRASFVGDLQDIVRTLGGDPENAGSLSGSLHRGWMNLKAAITGNDEAAIYNECERSEDVAKAEYQNVLEQELPAYIQQTVQSQYSTILSTHDRVKELRDHAARERSSTARPGF